MCRPLPLSSFYLPTEDIEEAETASVPHRNGDKFSGEASGRKAQLAQAWGGGRAGWEGGPPTPALPHCGWHRRTGGAAPLPTALLVCASCFMS